MLSRAYVLCLWAVLLRDVGQEGRVSDVLRLCVRDFEWGDCSCSCNGVRDRSRRVKQ